MTIVTGATGHIGNTLIRELTARRPGVISMNKEDRIIQWLLNGDVSIQYYVYKDLLNLDLGALQKLQKRIESEGWGAHLLSERQENGHWGRGFYQPKWTSTHYTLLTLKNIGLPRENEQARSSIKMIFNEAIGRDGGINYSKNLKRQESDVCIDGMVLNLASYFQQITPQLLKIIDLLLSVQMKDGGWNCEHIHGATHSSLHTTVSVLEGLLEYKQTGVDYRKKEVEKAEKEGTEFILEHQLYKSHRTGETIDKKMLMLSYPSRWRYDILRAFDYFQSAKIKYDDRMNSAIGVLLKKQRNDGKWPLQMKHPGQVYFNMEQVGQASRWNTLRALRVLRYYGISNSYA